MGVLYGREFIALVGDAKSERRLSLKEVHLWAVAAHNERGQMYGMTKADDGGMDGYHPYRYHLTGVVLILVAAGVRDEIKLMAALLHDVFEDTSKTVRDAIEAGIPLRAVALAYACTDGAEGTRYEKKMVALKKLRRIWGSKPIKLADRLHNFGHAIDCADERKERLYIDEHPTFSRMLRSRFCVCATRRLWRQLDWIMTPEGRHVRLGRSGCCANADGSRSRLTLWWHRRSARRRAELRYMQSGRKSRVSQPRPAVWIRKRASSAVERTTTQGTQEGDRLPGAFLRGDTFSPEHHLQCCTVAHGEHLRIQRGRDAGSIPRQCAMHVALGYAHSRGLEHGSRTGSLE